MFHRRECPLVKMTTESIRPKSKEQTCLFMEKKPIVMMCFPLDLLRVTDLAPRCGEGDTWQCGTPATLLNWVQQGAAVHGAGGSQVGLSHCPAAGGAAGLDKQEPGVMGRSSRWQDPGPGGIREGSA